MVLQWPIKEPFGSLQTNWYASVNISGLDHMPPFIHPRIPAVPGIIACRIAQSSCTILAHLHEVSLRVVSRLVPGRGESLLASDAYSPVTEVGANIEEDIMISLKYVRLLSFGKLHSMTRRHRHTVCTCKFEEKDSFRKR